MFKSLVTDGTVSDGFCFSSVSRDYSDAPDIRDVDTSSNNLPSGWVPNPTSPGAGSLNPADKPSPPSGFGQTPVDNWGTGVGSKLQPSESSLQHSQMEPGTYVMGKGPGS